MRIALVLSDPLPHTGRPNFSLCYNSEDTKQYIIVSLYEKTDEC
jgi:hypothetical protein